MSGPSRKALPAGYRLYLVGCPEGYDHDTYLLTFNGANFSQECALLRPGWWVAWRLRAKARSLARRGIEPVLAPRKPRPRSAPPT